MWQAMLSALESSPGPGESGGPESERHKVKHSHSPYSEMAGQRVRCTFLVSGYKHYTSLVYWWIQYMLIGHLTCAGTSVNMGDTAGNPGKSLGSRAPSVFSGELGSLYAAKSLSLALSHYSSLQEGRLQLRCTRNTTLILCPELRASPAKGWMRVCGYGVSIGFLRFSLQKSKLFVELLS